MPRYLTMPNTSPLLRSAVAAHAEAAGLSRQQAYDVTAVAHELAANAVRHGAGHGQLRLTSDNGSLCCQVASPQPSAATPPTSTTAPALPTTQLGAQLAEWTIPPGDWERLYAQITSAP